MFLSEGSCLDRLVLEGARSFCRASLMFRLFGGPGFAAAYYRPRGPQMIKRVSFEKLKQLLEDEMIIAFKNQDLVKTTRPAIMFRLVHLTATQET